MVAPPSPGEAAPPAARWPISPVRDRYVTPFSGVSFELEPYQVGVSRAALRTNTTLRHEDRVIVTPLPDAGSRPLVTQTPYEVVPLDDDRPDALGQSPDGEAVFSTYELDVDEPTVVQLLRRGHPVTLNATLARFGFDVRNVITRAFAVRDGSNPSSSGST